MQTQKYKDFLFFYDITIICILTIQTSKTLDSNC